MKKKAEFVDQHGTDPRFNYEEPKIRPRVENNPTKQIVERINPSYTEEVNAVFSEMRSDWDDDLSVECTETVARRLKKMDTDGLITQVVALNFLSLLPNLDERCAEMYKELQRRKAETERVRKILADSITGMPLPTVSQRFFDRIWEDKDKGWG